MIDFKAWPKTPRLFRDAIITEKLDGTNAAVHIQPVSWAEMERTPLDESGGFAYHWTAEPGEPAEVVYLVGAQSRNRLIGPAASGRVDNMGFAAWVQEHAHNLITVLGAGVHYGEWWGSGIQRGYGLPAGDKRFSLFNVHRYGKLLAGATTEIPGLGIVPVLDTYTFSTERVRKVRDELAETGSQAAPGFMRPEGVVVFHSQSGSVFKSLIENDDVPKGATA